MVSSKREILRAVHDDDLQGLLQALGLLADYSGKRLQCGLCRDVITPENLYAIYPHGGQVKVACSRPDCIEQLLAIQGPESRG